MGSSSSKESRERWEKMMEKTHKHAVDKTTLLSKENYKDHKMHKGDKIGGNF